MATLVLAVGLVTLPWSHPVSHARPVVASPLLRRWPVVVAAADVATELPPPRPWPVIASAGQYLQVQIFRPLLMNALIAYSIISRHGSGSPTRSQQKKAEYEENGSRITWVGAWVNLFLGVFKAFAGVYGHSTAMIADAGHTFSDLFSDGLTLLSVRMSSLPADVDHPYGHGRFESVGSLAIGTLLMGVGGSFGASAIAALRAPAVAPLGSVALWAAIVSVVSKEALYQATAAVGRRVRSPVLLANAWHHRSDALSSVVAVVGIGGSMIGWRVLDPLAGLLVGLMVAWMGLRISIEALAQLTDTSDYGVMQAAGDAARAVVGVEHVDQVRSRTMGGSSLIDLAIRVDPRLSASSAHRLAEEARLAVLKEVPEVSEVLVHVDTSPHDVSCPLQTSRLAETRPHHVVEEDVAAKLCELPEVIEVSRVDVFYLPAGLAVEAHVRMHEHLTVTELRAVAKTGRQRLLATSPDLTDAAVSLDLSERWDPPEGEGAAALGAALGAEPPEESLECAPAEPPVPTL